MPIATGIVIKLNTEGWTDPVLMIRLESLVFLICSECQKRSSAGHRVLKLGRIRRVLFAYASAAQRVAGVGTACEVLAFPMSLKHPAFLDCYWVGSFDFAFLVKIKQVCFSIKLTQSKNPVCSGVLTATEKLGAIS